MKESVAEALKASIDNGTDVSTTSRGSAIRERNLQIMKHQLYNNEEVRRLKENMQKRFGVDIFDSKTFPVNSWAFSWKKLRDKLELSEADSGSTFVQFLRAGVQAITNAMYESVSTTYEDWVTTVASGRSTELYAPNHGIAFPRQVPEQTKYPEVGAAALDIQLRNNKYGTMYAVTKELIDDDQTGSFQRQSGLLGQYMRLLTEVLCYGKLASVANMSYQDFLIPVSETQPSYEANYPYATSAAPLRGGGINRPVAYGALLQANIQDALIGLMNQRNLQGIKMQVDPSRLVIGPYWKFDAYVLMNSAYYPSGAAAAGSTGGAFAVNPLKGILDVTVSRYMFNNLGSVDANSKAWYIMDDSKPWFILQLRQPVAVEQEAVNSGRSFDEDVVRFKVSSRMNADHLDPRFVWRGNDGSV